MASLPFGTLVGFLRDFPVASVTIDVESRVTSWNRAAERLFGWSEEDVLGKPLPTVPDDRWAEHEARRRQVLEGRPISSFETVRRRRDGSPVAISLTTARLVDGAGDPLGALGLYEDIDQRMRTEEDLRESRERFRALVENTSDWIWEVDDETVYTYCSPQCVQLLGYEPEELVGRTPFDLMPPEEAERVEEIFREVASAREPFERLENRNLRKDGTEVVLETSGVPIFDRDGEFVGYRGIDRDVTGRKAAEAELRRLSVAIEQAAESVIITDRDARIEYVNPAFERITGFTAEEAIGETPNILKSGRQDDEFYREMWEAIEAGEIWKGVLVNRRKDGSLYHDDTTISPVRDEKGELTKFIAVKRDISREVELEKQVRRAQRLEAVGRLAGGIAHDFNNLLTAIQGYAEFLGERFGSDSTAAEDVRQIQAAAEKANALTRRLLAFGRRQPLEPRPVDGNDLVRRTLRLARGILPSSIEVSVDLAEDAGVVRVDPGQIEQVVINLIANARDALSGGGRIDVETRVLHVDASTRDGPVEERLAPGRHFALSIGDDGEGMDEDVRSRAFDPFFTTKEEGTGLGLSTCYGIVKQHGGAIRVDSEPGEGSRFEVLLPWIEGEAQALEIGQERVGERTMCGEASVLVVDDDISVRSVVVRALEKHGFDVLETGLPEMALDLAAGRNRSVDLLIVDLVMPAIDGVTLAKRILGEYPATKVLFISGHQEPDRPELPENSRLLRKPFSPDALVLAARKALWSDG